MPQQRVFWDYDGDNYLRVGGDEEDVLMNVLTEETPEDATVTASIKTKAGVAVTGATSLTLVHDAGTTGEETTYTVSVARASVSMPPGDYTAKVVATKGGVTGTKYVDITVRRG